MDDWGVVSRVIGGGGFFVVDQVRPPTATRTSVPQSAIAVVLLANNINRRGAFFFNDSPQPLYIALGAGASLASFTTKIFRNGFYEVQWPAYTGIITGIWGGAGGGTCQITELT